MLLVLYADGSGYQLRHWPTYFTVDMRALLGTLLERLWTSEHAGLNHGSLALHPHSRLQCADAMVKLMELLSGTSYGIVPVASTIGMRISLASSWSALGQLTCSPYF
eukprot:6480198-Amphidinium_carterae.2